MNASVTLFIIIPKWKQLSCPLTDECVHQMWYINTTEYYSAIKMKLWLMLQHR